MRNLYRRLPAILLMALIATCAFAQTKELTHVIIGNEGKFPNSGSITQYAVESGTATDGVYLSANGVAVGSVVQSFSYINDRIFAVINNAHKIVVLNPETFQQTGQITFAEGDSPREIVKVSDSKAYVTSLYKKKVLKVNLADYSVATDTIAMGLNPDKMIFHEGFAYVANRGYGLDSTIFKIDVTTDLVVDTINVSRGPTSMVVDSDNKLWVVCTGYSGEYDADLNVIEGTSKPGGLHSIDLSTGEEIAFAELASADEDIALDEANGKVYVNSGGVLAYDINTGQFDAAPLISGYFYAFAYDSVSKTFFGSDPKDFGSAGSVAMFDAAGTKTGEFSTGIAPGSFMFIYNNMTGTATEELVEVADFSLSQNYPNPFNPTTNIAFNLKKSASVQLQVFNTQGQLVATLAEGRYSYGSHQITFDASALSSGIYFYRLRTENAVEMKKMLLVK